MTNPDYKVGVRRADDVLREILAGQIGVITNEILDPESMYFNIDDTIQSIKIRKAIERDRRFLYHTAIDWDGGPVCGEPFPICDGCKYKPLHICGDVKVMIAGN